MELSIHKLVETILLYVVIVSVLRGLISNPKYEQYFRFFSGIILVLIMISPLFQVLHCQDQWYTILEKNILQMNLEEVYGQMEIAQDSFSDMVGEKYKTTVEQQVKTMAQAQGVTLKEVDVEMEQKGNEVEIKKISACIGKEEKQEESQIAIETVQIGNTHDRKKKADSSKKAKRIQKQISSFYVIGKDKVYIWK